MRYRRLHMFGIILATGILLGSGTMESRGVKAGKAAKDTVSDRGSSKDQLSFSKTSFVIPYGWHKTIKPKKAVDATGKRLLLRYTSSDTAVAKVNQKGKITGIGEGFARITVEAQGNVKATVRFFVQVKRQKTGWHGSSNEKKYYVNRDGKRALGYTTIGEHAYFFNKKTSWRLVKKWKYVNLNGKKYKLYFGKKGRRSLDVTKVLPKSTRYRIEVNLARNTVMVYARDGKNGYIIPAKAMICSGGKKGHETITGNYSSLRRAGNWHVLRYNSYGQYATRIKGPYLFHSVTYGRYGDHYSLQAKEYKKLGKSASHGCIRLQVKDAKWIYDNCSRCSVRLFYSKNKKTPIPRPRAVKIGKTSGGKYFDRTDSGR